MSTNRKGLVQERILPDVLANASPSACAELEHGCFHLFQLCGRRVQPSFRPEFINIFSEDFGPAVQDPCVAAHDGAARDVLSQDIHALGWNNALEDETGRWVESERLLDYGV